MFLRHLLAAALSCIASVGCVEDPAVPPNAMDWITGHWRDEANGNISEEIWTSGEGGVYFAVNRTIEEGTTVAFEFLRIQTDGGLTYVAQPNGGTPAHFDILERGDQRVLFANPDHEFPKHIEYKRDDNTLVARIWGEKDADEVIEFKWTLLAN